MKIKNSKNTLFNIKKSGAHCKQLTMIKLVPLAVVFALCVFCVAISSSIANFNAFAQDEAQESSQATISQKADKTINDTNDEKTLTTEENTTTTTEQKSAPESSTNPTNESDNITQLQTAQTPANEVDYISITSTTASGSVKTYLECDVPGMVWDSSTSTLTMTRVTLTGIYSIIIDDENLTDVNIVLIGENKYIPITPSISQSWIAINVLSSTSLKISGEGSLLIDNSEQQWDGNIGGIASRYGSVTIDNTSLTIKTGNSSAVNHGLISYGPMSITNSNVNIVTGSCSALNSAIACYNNLTLSGNKCVCDLTAGNSTSAGGKSFGIYVKSPNDESEIYNLTIKDGADIKCSSSGGYFNAAGCSTCNSNLSIIDSKINAICNCVRGGNALYMSANDTRECNFKNSDIFLTCTSSAFASGGLRAAANITVDNTIMNINLNSLVSNEGIMTGRSESGHAIYSSLAIKNKSQVKIILSDASRYNYGIFLNDDIDIEGPGTSLYIKTGNSSEGPTAGINLSSTTGYNAITIKNFATVNIDCGASSISEYGIFAKNGNIEISGNPYINSYVDPSGICSDDEKINIGATDFYGLETETYPQVAVNLTNYSMFNGKNVYSEEYPNKILQINAVNKTLPVSFVYDGFVLDKTSDQAATDGSWKWNHENLTLTLDNADMSEQGIVDIEVDGTDVVTIELTDGTENTINGGDVAGVAIGVYCTGSLNIEGHGKLAVNSSKGEDATNYSYGLCVLPEDGSDANLNIGSDTQVEVNSGKSTDAVSSTVATFVKGNVNIGGTSKVSSASDCGEFSSALLSTGNINISGTPSISLFADGNNSKAAVTAKAGYTEGQTNAAMLTASSATGAITFEGGQDNYGLTNCREAVVTDTMTQADFSQALTVGLPFGKGGTEIAQTSETASTGDYTFAIVAADISAVLGCIAIAKKAEGRK